MASNAANSGPEVRRADGSGSPGQSWHAAWTAALDELELDVGRAEALLAVSRTGAVDAATANAQDAAVTAALVEPTWRPPAELVDSGVRLPADLAGRAAALLERQRRTALALTHALTASRRELRLLERISPRTDARPVYHDRSV